MNRDLFFNVAFLMIFYAVRDAFQIDSETKIETDATEAESWAAVGDTQLTPSCHKLQPMQIGTMLHAACVLLVCCMWAAPICAPAAAKAKINYKSLEWISNQKGNAKRGHDEIWIHFPPVGKYLR